MWKILFGNPEKTNFNASSKVFFLVPR